MSNQKENASSCEPYALAMYDVRSKQDFIFRTDKLQEIVGASWIIRDVFKDYLFPAAKELTNADESCNKGIYSYKDNTETERCNDFSAERFEEHLKDGYIGEVVYDGGGNFLVVFKSEDVFREVTFEFTKRVMQSVGTLKVLATAVPVSDGFSDYAGDCEKLYAKHRIAEAEESNLSPWSCLPIVQVDRKSSQPLYDYENDENSGWNHLGSEIRGKIQTKGVRGKLTKESYAKLKKYFEEYRRIHAAETQNLNAIEENYSKMNEDILDNIVTEKGEDSLLAVVYIDGNSMGAKVQEATKNSRSYEDSIKKLREFSKDIQATYVDAGVEAALKAVKDDEKAFRVVVYAGDEINFIVNAHDAFDCAKNYLEYLQTEKDDASACAGIAVFHSHTPYSDVYRIAEEACESGKQCMKSADLKNESFIDFHICQGAIGISLEAIREHENSDIISRPWLIWNKDDDDALNRNQESTENITAYEDVRQVIDLLNVFSRTNVKGLIQASSRSAADLDMDLNRMYSHLAKEKQTAIKEQWNAFMNISREKRRKMVYDASLAYDLWFDAGTRRQSHEE